MINGSQWDAAQVATLTDRLHHLADAAGVPAPTLEIRRATRDTLPRIGGLEGEEVIAAPSWLLGAGAAEQAWFLAACLGWWTSPLPRRRRRLGHLVFSLFAAVVVLLAVFRPAERSWAVVVAVVAVTVSTTAVRAAASRWEWRAAEAAGRDVLRAAGHDPAALAWLVFGNRTDPAWPVRFMAEAPAPSERLHADKTPARRGRTPQLWK